MSDYSVPIFSCRFRETAPDSVSASGRSRAPHPPQPLVASKEKHERVEFDSTLSCQNDRSIIGSYYVVLSLLEIILRPRSMRE